MAVNVKNGTPVHGASLCETCLNAQIIRGYRASEEIVVCHATYPERDIPFRVHKCTSYLNKTRQTLRQMQDIAWVLGPKGSKRAGFLPPRDVPKDVREIEMILDEQK
jgi:hypothetical protein